MHASEAIVPPSSKPKSLSVKWIYDTVLGKSPLQLKSPFALWTAAMVRKLIAKRFGVHLSHSSACRLLAQMGMSAQRPLWRAHHQDPQAVRRFKEEDYPGLRLRYCSPMRRRAFRFPFVSSTGVRFVSTCSARGVPRGGRSSRFRWVGTFTSHGPWR